MQVLHGRERYPAFLIASQILAKHKKALVICGDAHFYEKDALGPLVERDYPGALLLVTPYIGFNEESCSSAFEAEIRDWPMPALVSPVRNTLPCKPILQVHGYTSFTAFHFAQEVTEAEKKAALKSWEDQTSGIAGHALLYLRPAAKLSKATENPDLYLESTFRKEINRRRMVVSGRPLGAPTDFETSQNPLRPYRKFSPSGNITKLSMGETWSSFFGFGIKVLF